MPLDDERERITTHDGASGEMASLRSDGVSMIFPAPPGDAARRAVPRRIPKKPKRENGKLADVHLERNNHYHCLLHYF
jgi:hypothetical protein